MANSRSARLRQQIATTYSREVSAAARTRSPPYRPPPRSALRYTGLGYVMNCPGCGASIFDASRACGRCGASLHVGSAPDDAQATTAWAHGFAQSQTSDTEPTESLAGFEADLPATRRRRRAWFVAGAAVIAAAVTAIVSFGTSVHGDVAKRTSVSATTSNSGSEANEWWTSAPLGERRDSVEVLAYGFPGIDERDLGRVFDVDLKPIAGAVPLFEVRPPKRVRRNEISKRLLRTWRVWI